MNSYHYSQFATTCDMMSCDKNYISFCDPNIARGLFIFFLKKKTKKEIKSKISL